MSSPRTARVLIHLGVQESSALSSPLLSDSGSSPGSKVPFFFYFFHHSPGPEQMVWLCWLSSLLLCFHGNVGHRDHLCLGLSGSILWRRTSALWPLPLACPHSGEFENVPPGSFVRSSKDITPQAWLWTGLKREGRRRGCPYPSCMAEANLQWWHIWTICPLSPQLDSIITDYCPDVKRDTPKVVSTHQATDI